MGFIDWCNAANSYGVAASHLYEHWTVFIEHKYLFILIETHWLLFYSNGNTSIHLNWLNYMSTIIWTIMLVLVNCMLNVVKWHA